MKTTTRQKELEKTMKKEHLAFCREYVLSGKNGKQSYIKVYGNKIKDSTAEVNASTLLRNTKVAEYLGILKEEVKEKYNISVETQLKKTAEILELSKQAKEFRTALACVQEESKLGDVYSPEKTENTTKIVWEEEKTYADE